MGRVTQRRKVVRFEVERGVARRQDTVAVEEPLEVRVGGEQLTVTMRLPGHDIELVHGLLRSEGVIASRDDVLAARYCAGAVTTEDGFDANTYNVVDVTLAGTPRGLPVTAQRSLASHGGCGLCGKTTIDAVMASAPPRDADDDLRVGATDLLAMTEAMRPRQKVFEATGGVHAAALFTPDATLRVLREDIGRHNAVDKVLGWALLDGHDPAGDVLVVSSRASFEIVAKAAMSGVRVLVAVSAPSSLAIEAADDLGMTLVAFARRSSLNVYTHPHRVLTDVAADEATAPGAAVAGADGAAR